MIHHEDPTIANLTWKGLNLEKVWLLIFVYKILSSILKDFYLEITKKL